MEHLESSREELSILRSAILNQSNLATIRDGMCLGRDGRISSDVSNANAKHVVLSRYEQNDVTDQTASQCRADLEANFSPALAAQLHSLLRVFDARYCDSSCAMHLADMETHNVPLLTALEVVLRVYDSHATRGIAIMTLDGRLVGLSQAIPRMIGYTADGLRSRTLAEITHPDDVDTDQSLFSELVNGNRDSFSKESRYLHKNGRIVWCNLAAQLLRHNGDRPLFAILVITDISRRKQIEIDLAEAKRDLIHGREAERLRIARELHDTAVQDLLDIKLQLAEMSGHKEGSHLSVPIAEIEAFQHKVVEVTNQLRDLVRELRPPGLEEFGLVAALKGYLADLRWQRPNMPLVELDLRGDDRELPIATSLPLFRAAQEAIRNVLRHAHAGHIFLSLQIDDHEVTVRVYDDGIGFVMPKTLHSLTRGGHFGLINVVERIKLADGTVDISSRPGDGTVITIRTPIEEKKLNIKD